MADRNTLGLRARSKCSRKKSATRLLHHLSQIFRDNSVPPAAPVGQRVDRKLRRKIQEKKIAMGHKPDDHEETPRQDMGGMTMGW